MKLKIRQHPHPVIGNGDDFPNSNFQSSIEIRLAEPSWNITCEFKCENEHVKKLVADGKASYILHTECPSIPGSRRRFKTRMEKETFTIPSGDIANELVLAALIVADEKADSYAPKGMHPDYKGTKISVMPHDIIAQDSEGTKIFDLNRGGLDSLLKVRRSDVPGDKIVRFEERDHFWVILPQEDFDNWVATQKISKEIDRHVISPSFVLPAVVEAIERVKKDPGMADDDGPRWARCLSHRLYGMGMDINKVDTIESAQKILDFPIGRVCEHALAALSEEN